MNTLVVISPGPHTTVQDAGRVGFQDVGVPESGPLDRLSFDFANALVGNPRGAPALEMLLMGPTLKVEADSVRIAVVGAAGGIEVRSRNPRAIAPGQSARLARDEVLKIGALGDSVCAYLAIEGGLDVAPVLGSAATYVRGGIGGIHGRRLQAKDIVPLKLAAAEAHAERALPRALDPAFDRPVRVVLGPQSDWFTEEGVRTFLSSEYTVSQQADRMGFRLEGPEVAHARGYNIVSDGTVPGAIQVPGSGRPIVLMVDHQTTGGYPKIATVISADLPVVGRRKPGRRVRFVAVDVAEAERLRRAQEAEVQRTIESLRIIGEN